MTTTLHRNSPYECVLPSAAAAAAIVVVSGCGGGITFASITCFRRRHANICCVLSSQSTEPLQQTMSWAEPTSASAPLFLSDDSEAEVPEDVGVASGRRREEVGAGEGREVEEPGDPTPASGVSERRALLIVLILCYVNLLNYMDRFTVAGKGGALPRPRPPPDRLLAIKLSFSSFSPPGVLPDIEHYFGINDEKSGLLQTGGRSLRCVHHSFSSLYLFITPFLLFITHCHFASSLYLFITPSLLFITHYCDFSMSSPLHSSSSYPHLFIPPSPLSIFHIIDIVL